MSHNVTQCHKMSHRVKACLAGTCGLPCGQIFANIYSMQTNICKHFKKSFCKHFKNTPGCHADKYLQTFTPTEFPLKVKPLSKRAKTNIFWFHQAKLLNWPTIGRHQSKLLPADPQALLPIAPWYFSHLITLYLSPLITLYLSSLIALYLSSMIALYLSSMIAPISYPWK